MKKVAIYPGRFQFPHKGHLQTYQQLVKQFDTVWVAMTNCFDDSNSDSPLNYDDRRKLLIELGIWPYDITQIKNPYRCDEIVDYYQDDTIIVFIVGEKDRDRFDFGPKLDGSAKYLQSYEDNQDDLRSKTQHAYVKFAPTATFQINYKFFTSASEVREFYRNLKTVKQREAFAKQHYHDSHLTKILDKAI